MAPMNEQENLTFDKLHYIETINIKHKTSFQHSNAEKNKQV